MAQSNGHLNGASDAQNPQIDVSNVLHALQLVHNPATTNENRRDASNYLEQLKKRSDVATVGYTLGNDANQAPLVRHFGLSLLEHVVRHEGPTLNEEQSEELRGLVVSLGHSLQATPQAFIRNKIAELWIEHAKRSWALEWYNLDEYLVDLWSRTLVEKDFVLTILENLSEDIFIREDTTAVLRDRDLNSAVVEVFTSSQNYTGGVKIGDTTHHLRYGEEGWLTRITRFLNDCLENDSISKNAKSTCIAALATLRSAFAWVMTPSIVNSECLAAVCTCMMKQDSDIILASIDALLALYGRPRLEEIEIQALVYPLCQPENTAIFKQVYSWSIVGIDDIGSTRYVVSKKSSELLSHFATWIVQYSPPAEIDFIPFLMFLIEVARHDSLIVSIPALHSWQKVIQSSRWRKTDAVRSCIEPVLHLTTQRIVAYDQLPEAAEDPAVIFVNDEIELFPERQGFYLNYRRFCFEIIDWISYTFLDDAVNYLLTLVDTGLNDVAVADSNLDLTQYSRGSMSVIHADAQYMVVDAAFKGLSRWMKTHEENRGEQQTHQMEKLTQRIKGWATNTLAQRKFNDPLIRQRQIKSAVETSSRALSSDTGFAFVVLEHILSSFVPVRPEYLAYSEAVNELHAYASSELRRLSLEHATYFVTFYEQLEAKFSDLIRNGGVDDKVQIDLRSALFLIVQRAEGLDRGLRLARLQTFIEPMTAVWRSQHTKIQSFDTFVKSQAFDQVVPYLANNPTTHQPDWSTVGFSQDGVRVQEAMAAGATLIPLRQTRVMLTVSTDKLEPDSEDFQIVRELWVPLLSDILSNILRLVSYNHRLHDVEMWPNISPNMTNTVQRILRDRYWQSGISEGSMQNFHQQVRATKSTMEGFASSVRGRIRNNLENCYSIIHTLGRLGSHFYGMKEAPNAIAQGLLGTATPLSVHHFGTLLSMLPKLIEDCPPQDRSHFLPPVLSTLLQQMDVKCSNEWHKLQQRGDIPQQDDNLSDEMRDESVLRQMSYRAVNMVSFWLDPQRELKVENKKTITNNQSQLNGGQPVQTFREFVLNNTSILEVLLPFCTHAISFKDTKTCATMVASLQKFVPMFSTEIHLQGQEAAAVREYISRELLKSTITSLNDGYFADYQSHLATLVAVIWLTCGLPTHVTGTETQAAHDRPAWTQTPHNILLSIPGLTEPKINEAATALVREGLNGRPRKLRAIVLQLLEGVRGVRLSEIGKIDTRYQQSKLMEKYKHRDNAGMQVEGGDHERVVEDGIDLGGVAAMFG